MDVFDVAGVMEADKEVFRAESPGQYLRLIDDHQSGVFTTPADAPVSLRLDPKEMKSVERVAAQNGAVCVVTITYRVIKEGDEERTQTLVLEKARSTAAGLLNGVAHARRFCKRLYEWNGEIVCPVQSNS
jgi:hypothetical protein